MKIMLTGLPGCGKTTVIRKVVETVALPVVGFLTEEIRKSGKRKGFSIESLDGRKAVMSHVDFGGPYRVGRYGVDVESFESIALASLEPPNDRTLVIIDEIGKMECFSARFIGAVRTLLDSPNPVLGTVAMKGGGFPAEVRCHSKVRLMEVTKENRDSLHSHLKELLESV